MRAKRQARGGGAARARAGGFGAPPPVDDAPPPAPLGLDADIVVATLTERVEQVRLDAAVDVRAERPVSTWYWPAVAAILLPALALVLFALL